MLHNENALNFAKTLNDLDDNMPKGRSRCFDFGQWYGCRADCPVFSEGKCEVEDAEAMALTIQNDNNLSEEDIEQIKKLYPNIEEFQSL